MSVKENIKTCAFNPEIKSGFEIVSLKDLYEKGKTVLYKPHRTNFYHVLYFEKGITSHMIDFQEYAIQPQSLFFVRSHSVHAFGKLNEAEGYAILFTEEFFYRAEASRILLKESPLFSSLYTPANIRIGDDEPIIKLLLHLMEKNQKKGGKYAIDILHSHLEALLYEALSLQEEHKTSLHQSSPELSIVQRLNSMLDDHYAERAAVSFYAEKLSLSEKQLNRATDRVLGKSPKELIDERLTLEIKRMLCYTNASVKEISLDLGFEEASYFIKFFKKHAAMTPMEFRHKHLS